MTLILLRSARPDRDSLPEAPGPITELLAAPKLNDRMSIAFDRLVLGPGIPSITKYAFTAIVLSFVPKLQSWLTEMWRLALTRVSATNSAKTTWPGQESLGFFARHEAADLVTHHCLQIMRKPRHCHDVRQLRGQAGIGVRRI